MEIRKAMNSFHGAAELATFRGEDAQQSPGSLVRCSNGSMIQSLLSALPQIRSRHPVMPAEVVFVHHRPEEAQAQRHAAEHHGKSSRGSRLAKWNTAFKAAQF